MEAIILAGGFGTRLAQVVRDVPKPMAPVAGKPFLQYVVDDLIRQGVDHMVLAVCYKKEVIMDFFGDRYNGADIRYSVEAEPLLTGGAIKKALGMCSEERVFVINGDTFFCVDLKEMRRFSQRMGRNINIAVKEMRDFSRYGSVAVDTDMAVTAFHEKQFCERGYINGGVYDICRQALMNYPAKFSMENECFPKMLKAGEIIAFASDGLFIDIGVPEDYKRAQSMFEGMA